MNQTSFDATYFDVREIPCRIKHGQIIQRFLDLPVGQHFVLVNDHDPVPLYYQFSAMAPGAFTWEYLVRGLDEFHVKITRTAASAPPAPHELPTKCSHEPAAAPVESGVVEIDARGLEPPEPLVRILTALETLPAGVALRALTDRSPCHLFGEAEQRGFRHDSAEQPDGTWVTRLERA